MQDKHYSVPLAGLEGLGEQPLHGLGQRDGLDYHWGDEVLEIVLVVGYPFVAVLLHHSFEHGEDRGCEVVPQEGLGLRFDHVSHLLEGVQDKLVQF